MQKLFLVLAAAAVGVVVMQFAGASNARREAAVTQTTTVFDRTQATYSEYRAYCAAHDDIGSLANVAITLGRRQARAPLAVRLQLSVGRTVHFVAVKCADGFTWYARRLSGRRVLSYGDFS